MSNLLTELRSFKIYDMAVFDFSLSMIGFYYIAKFFKSERPMLWAFGSIPLSIFIHKLFDVQTALTKKYDNFINQQPTDQQTQTKQPTDQQTKPTDQQTKPTIKPVEIKPVDIHPISYIPTSVLNRLNNEMIIKSSSSNPLWVRSPNIDWVSKNGTVALEETGISAGEVASAIGKIAIGFL